MTAAGGPVGGAVMTQATEVVEMVVTAGGVPLGCAVMEVKTLLEHSVERLVGANAEVVPVAATGNLLVGVATTAVAWEVPVAVAMGAAAARRT